MLGQQACQLRKFHIIANQNADLATIGIEGLQLCSSFHPPAFGLIGGNMQFFVLLTTPVSAAKVAHIVQAIFSDRRQTARNDVYIVIDGQVRKLLTDGFGLFGNFPNGTRFRKVVVLSHQRCVE